MNMYFLTLLGANFSHTPIFREMMLKLHFLNSVNHLKHQTLGFTQKKLEGPS